MNGEDEGKQVRDCIHRVEEVGFLALRQTLIFCKIRPMEADDPRSRNSRD
jgi:hypothetical protein